MNYFILTHIACSRLSVSGGLKKRVGEKWGLVGKKERSSPFLSRIPLAADPALRPLAFSIVLTDREPGTGYNSHHFIAWEGMNSVNVWLHSSVGRASHWYRGGHGFDPVEALIFFRLLLFNCLRLGIYCDDHSSLSSTTAVHMNYFILTSHGANLPARDYPPCPAR